MSRRAAFTQADATRALRAAVAAGLKPSGYRIDPNGVIHVEFGKEGGDKRNGFDEALG
jgi:hypothetical protein